MRNKRQFAISRRLKWIFVNSGILSLAFEHFLAMVPATILVPILVNNTIGVTVIDMSLVLFTSGLGTIIFALCSRSIGISKKDAGESKNITAIPAYLGSSFAYIGLTIYLIQVQAAEGIAPAMAYVYVGWSYVFSGTILVLLSFLYKIKLIVRFFSVFLPAAVIGPAISLIGLELSDTAIADAGLNSADGSVNIKSVFVAFSTLLVIVLFSLIKRKIFKNAAIIIGMVIGYIVYVVVNGPPQIDWGAIDWFSVPEFNCPLTVLPPNLPRLFISVIPATLIVFTENIGRVTVINRMQQDDNADTQLFDEKTVKVMGRALRSHGCATVAASLIGSVPNTIYAENIAVMGIYKTGEERNEPDSFIKNLMNPMSVVPYWIAAIIAILFSFVGALQSFLLGIPKPVIGGMELFLFGVISAPGIQLLVDQRVNYKKVSNQLVTAAVLITGISELSIKFNWFELKGMSLGLVVGFLLNALVLLLKRFGVLCDPLSMEEVLSAGINALPECHREVNLAISKSLMDVNSISVKEIKNVLAGYEGLCIADGVEKQSEFLRDAIEHAGEIYVKTDKTILKISRTTNRITLDIRLELLPEREVIMYNNDYQDAINIDSYVDKITLDNTKEVSFLTIDLSRNIPLHKVEKLIQLISWENIQRAS